MVNLSVNEELVPVPIPALVAVLLNTEDKKGSPLTQIEVIRIRDSANCMMMPRDVADKMKESRGYEDIDPENIWEEWQQVRLELRNNDE